MHIAAVRTKASEKIVLAVPVIAATVDGDVFAAVEVAGVEIPISRLGLGIGKQPLGDKAGGLEVGHHLMRRHQVGLAELVEAVLHVIGWQQACEIKIHSKEITYRVGVFSAREPLQGIGRALGEDAFLNDLQGLGSCRGSGLRLLLRRHFASLEHGRDGLQQLLIGE